MGVKYIVLCTDVHQIDIQSSKLLKDREGICKDLAWMVGIITAVDKWNRSILAKSFNSFIFDQTCHDDINITADIFDLGNRLAEYKVGVLP